MLGETLFSLLLEVATVNFWTCWPHNNEEEHTCSSSTLAAKGSASEALTTTVERTIL